MKSAMVLLVSGFVWISSALASPAAMAAGAAPRVGALFWQDVRKLVIQCAVEPIYRNSSGEMVAGRLKSLCREIQLTSDGAIFRLNGVVYRAILTESEDSDGGDLNHLVVVSPSNIRVAERRNVLAFGDVLRALAGGRTEFRKEFEGFLR